MNALYGVVPGLSLMSYGGYQVYKGNKKTGLAKLALGVAIVAGSYFAQQSPLPMDNGECRLPLEILSEKLRDMPEDIEGIKMGDVFTKFDEVIGVSESNFYGYAHLYEYINPDDMSENVMWGFEKDVEDQIYPFIVARISSKVRLISSLHSEETFAMASRIIDRGFGIEYLYERMSLGSLNRFANLLKGFDVSYNYGATKHQIHLTGADPVQACNLTDLLNPVKDGGGARKIIYELLEKTRGITCENFLPWRNSFHGYGVGEYMDGIRPHHLKESVMWGVDNWKRFFVAIKAKCSDSLDEKMALMFQRYSGSPNSIYGAGSWMESSGCFPWADGLTFYAGWQDRIVELFTNGAAHFTGKTENISLA